jgi:hypothetical protein
MAKFQGFESFEVYADTGSVFIEQVSHEFGKEVIVEIPVHLWQEFVKAAEFEIDQAAE